MTKQIFDVYNEKCPSRKVLEIISDKWTILIIKLLSQRSYRFGELRREIGGISQKVLTQSLRELARNGFILRHDHHTLPLRVDYSLTELGNSLSSIFNLITDWSEKNIEKIKHAELIYNKKT